MCRHRSNSHSLLQDKQRSYPEDGIFPCRSPQPMGVKIRNSHIWLAVRLIMHLSTVNDRKPTSHASEWWFLDFNFSVTRYERINYNSTGTCHWCSWHYWKVFRWTRKQSEVQASPNGVFHFLSVSLSNHHCQLRSFHSGTFDARTREDRSHQRIWWTSRRRVGRRGEIREGMSRRSHDRSLGWRSGSERHMGFVEKRKHRRVHNEHLFDRLEDGRACI